MPNVAQLLEELECKIQLPKAWEETFFSECGTLPTSFDERRRFVRFNLRQKGLIYLRDSLPSISREQRIHVVYTCNISRGGVAILHFEQLFPGELADLWLGKRKLTIEVAQCTHIGPRCNLIGAQFATAQLESDLEQLATAQS